MRYESGDRLPHPRLPEVEGGSEDNPESKKEIGNCVRRDRIPNAIPANDEPLIGKGAQNPREPFEMADTEDNSSHQECAQIKVVMRNAQEL